MSTIMNTNCIPDFLTICLLGERADYTPFCKNGHYQKIANIAKDWLPCGEKTNYGKSVVNRLVVLLQRDV